MASKLQLSIICGSNERVAPLLSGEVEVEGVDLIHTKSDPSETFWRQLNFEEFEISEMSMSSYLIAKDQGADMVMLPVYPTRRWFHTEIQMHEDAGIKAPSDIAGKRFGVPEYQQTSSLWVRGVLEHDFGVSQYIPSGLIFGAHYLRETQRIFGEDPYPYGVKDNRDYIQTCIDFSFEQGFIKSKPKIEDLYAPAVRDF